MSTRCQVQVEQQGVGWDQKITLYHHTDGYPTYMLPIIEKAWRLSGMEWEAGRAGKAASFLCATHPGVFEPEEGHELHGDIEWYYRITLLNDETGVQWIVSVNPPPFGRNDAMGEITELAKRAGAIEEARYKNA